MESPSPSVGKVETGERKEYLYHMVPSDMRGNTLYPLNTLKDIYPDIYEKYAAKYSDRPEIMRLLIPTLQCAWNDALHLTPIHPKQLKQALVDSGFEPVEMNFFQVDPELLDAEKTTVYAYRASGNELTPDDFEPFDREKLEQYSILSERTKRHYRDQVSQGKHPLLFVGVPHILHKGSLDVSKLSVITV